MLQPLKNKVVLVTGSARRVGRAILLGFAAQGANVVVHHSNSPEDAEATAADARKLGVEALIVQGDYANHDDVVRNFRQIQAHYGRIDVLVNSASVFQSVDLLDVTPDEWNLSMDINLRAPFWCTQEAGRMMRDGKIAGSIINIADTSG